MHGPTLAKLPPPPPGKSGWPWTEESPPLPEAMPDGQPWPRISIVTPSYNQGQFIEETIRSVLLQGYPDLEYIIIDGSSTDESVEIIKKYEPWLASWVSESDRGQAHALNKGFSRATGEIFAWLNSDDTFQPQALYLAAIHLLQHSQIGMVYGHARVIDQDGNLLTTWLAPKFDLAKQLFEYRYIPQQSAFFRRQAFEQVGALCEDMYYTMDFDLWLRIGASFPIGSVNYILGNIREHESSKTVSNWYGNRPEILKSLQRFFALPNLSSDIRSLEPYAYSILYLHRSLGDLQSGEMEKAKLFLEQAFHFAPDLAHKYREHMLRLLVDYSPQASEQLDNFLQWLATNCPENAMAFQELLKVAHNRKIITAAANSDDRLLKKKAKDSLSRVLRYDRSWLRNRQVFLAVLGLFIGQHTLTHVAKVWKSMTIPVARRLNRILAKHLVKSETW